MFSIPDIQASNFICCTRSLPCKNIEILFFFLLLQSSINLNIAKQFEKQWSFLSCLGAMEGKNIIQKRDNSLHYPSYKNTHSILLLTVTGPDY